MSRRLEQDLLATGPPGGAGADPADGRGGAGAGSGISPDPIDAEAVAVLRLPARRLRCWTS